MTSTEKDKKRSFILEALCNTVIWRLIGHIYHPLALWSFGNMRQVFEMWMMLVVSAVTNLCLFPAILYLHRKERVFHVCNEFQHYVWLLIIYFCRFVGFHWDIYDVDIVFVPFLR